MFSFFRAKKKKSADAFGPETKQSKRMTLEERKAFRQEMLYEGIREAFLEMEVISSMYKFKVMPVDERHHRFIAMIDVAKSFVTGKTRRTDSFAKLERAIRASTYKRFGVHVVGTYWRVSETEESFVREVRASDPVGGTLLKTMQRKEDSLFQEEDAGAGQPSLARYSYNPVSENEAKAFMDALRAGQQLPAVHVGEQEYQSDMAPFDAGIMIGGTQYGRL